MEKGLYPYPSRVVLVFTKRQSHYQYIILKMSKAGPNIVGYLLPQCHVSNGENILGACSL